MTVEDPTERLALIVDGTKRGLALMAELSANLHPNVRPVVVEGFAVEFYSTGGYRTNDIDACCMRPAEAGAVLEGWGFRRVNRHWVSDPLGLQVEFPRLAIEARARERLTTVRVDGREVMLIGVEDLILDRLNGWIHSGSTDDRRWAVELAAIAWEQLDRPYLQREAEVDRTAAALQEVFSAAQEARHD